MGGEQNDVSRGENSTRTHSRRWSKKERKKQTSVNAFDWIKTKEITNERGRDKKWRKLKQTTTKKTNKRIQKCCGLGFLLERQKETPKVKMPHSMPWDRASLSQFIFQRLLRLYWWCDRTYMQSDRCLLYVCTSNKTNTILFCSLHWDFLYFFFFFF